MPLQTVVETIVTDHKINKVYILHQASISEAIPSDSRSDDVNINLKFGHLA